MSLLRGTRVLYRLDTNLAGLKKHGNVCYRGLATAQKSYDTSHAKKEGSAQPSKETFQSLLAKGAEKYESKDVFVSHSENVKHTHKELKSITEGYSIGLISPGRLYPGDRFVTCVPDGQDHLYAYLASGRDGVYFYPFPANVPMPELLLRIRDSKAKGLLMPETIPNRDFIADLDAAMPEYRSLMNGELFKFPRVPNLRTIFHTGGNMWPGMTSWGTICLRNPLPNSTLVPKLPEIPHSQGLLVLPQSRAQGEEFTLAAHTQGGLIQTGVAIAESLGLTSEDRVSMAVPYHVGVVYPVVLGVLSKAAVFVQPFNRFRAQYVLDTIVKDKATVLFIRGSDLPSLWEKPLDKFDLSSLRTVVVVDGLTAELEGKVKETLKAKQVIGLDTIKELPGQLVGLLRSGGEVTPLPYTEAKIVDDQGNTVKVGASGKLKTKGPHVSTSYGGPATWVDKDGWLDTSLNAKMTSNGSFNLL